MDPCSQKQRIERLEGAVDKIAKDVTQIATDVTTIKVKMEPLAEMVESHDHTLRGVNGDIGLNAKVANAVDAMSDFTSAMRGQGKEAGLIDDIRSLKEWMSSLRGERTWLTRMIVGIIIIEIGAVIFAMFKYFPPP